MKPATSRTRRPRSKPRAAPQGKNHDERMLDKALEDTFPASDPPAQTQPHDRSPGSKDAPGGDGAKK